MAAVVRPNGKLVLTAEAWNTDDETTDAAKERGFRLMKTGRFAYTKEYLDEIISSLKDSTFEVEIFKRFSPRLNNGEPVPGYLYIANRIN